MLVAFFFATSMVALGATAADAADNCSRYGTQDVCGTIRDKYVQLGGTSSRLGLPTSGEFSAAGGRGRGTHFEHGEIYWSPQTGAHEVFGWIVEKWRQLNWENGFLGFPTTDELSVGGSGQVSEFEGGSIYSSPAGAHAVQGVIRDAWRGAGGATGALGFPVTSENDDGGSAGGKVSFFQHGSVRWTPREGARIYVSPANPDLHEEGDTIDRLPLAEFISLRQSRATDGSSPYNWTTNSCSGPTPEAIDRFFDDACTRHDFGWRNFGNGLTLDKSGMRKSEIDLRLRDDAHDLCRKNDNPKLNWLKTYRATNCQSAADRLYAGVRNWEWRGIGRPKIRPLAPIDFVLSGKWIPRP